VCAHTVGVAEFREPLWSLSPVVSVAVVGGQVPCVPWGRVSVFGVPWGRGLWGRGRVGESIGSHRRPAHGVGVPLGDGRRYRGPLF